MIHLIANPTMCAMGGWCWVCMSGDCGFNAISKQFCPLYTTTSSFILQYMLLVCSRSSSFKSQDICRVLSLIHDIMLAKVGLYWMWCPVWKSGKLSKSRLSGDQTFSYLDAGLLKIEMFLLILFWFV